MTARHDHDRLIAEFEELKKRLRESQERQAGVEHAGGEHEFPQAFAAEPYAERAPEAQARDSFAQQAEGVRPDLSGPFAAEPFVARVPEPQGRYPSMQDGLRESLRADREAHDERRRTVDEFSLMELDLRRERQEASEFSAARRMGVPDAAELVAIRSSFGPTEDGAGAFVTAPTADAAGSRRWLPIIALIGLIAVVGLALAFRDDLTGRNREANAPQAPLQDDAGLAAKEPSDETSLSPEEKSAADALIKEQSEAVESARAPNELKTNETPSQTATIAPNAASEPKIKENPASPAPAPAASKSELTQPPASSERFVPPKPSNPQTAQPSAEPAKPKVISKPADRPRAAQAPKPLKVIAAPPAAETKLRSDQIAAPPLPVDAAPPPPVAAAQPSGGVDPLGFMKRTFSTVTGTVTSWGRDVIGRP